MPKLIKKVRSALTPPIYKEVAEMRAVHLMLWVSLAFLSLGFMWALIMLYDRIRLIEDAIAVLAS